VLSLDVEGLDQPRAWIERDGTGHHAVAVAFAPSFERASVQHADGSWDLSDDLSQIIRQDRDALEAAPQGARGDAQEIRQA
jgi:hypothetical protein